MVDPFYCNMYWQFNVYNASGSNVFAILERNLYWQSERGSLSNITMTPVKRRKVGGSRTPECVQTEDNKYLKHVQGFGEQYYPKIAALKY